MANPVTDPELLAKLNGSEPKGKVTDPALLAVLEGNAHPLVAAHVDMANVDAAGNATGASPVESAPVPEMGYGEQMRRVGGAVDCMVHRLANGIQFMDRIAAAGGAATGIGGKFGDYSGNLEAQRGEDKKLSENAPGVDTPVGRVSLDTAGHLVG